MLLTELIRLMICTPFVNNLKKIPHLNKNDKCRITNQEMTMENTNVTDNIDGTLIEQFQISPEQINHLNVQLWGAGGGGAGCTTTTAPATYAVGGGGGGGGGGGYVGIESLIVKGGGMEQLAI